MRFRRAGAAELEGFSEADLFEDDTVTIDISKGQDLLSSQIILGQELLNFLHKYKNICIVHQIKARFSLMIMDYVDLCVECTSDFFSSGHGSKECKVQSRTISGTVILSLVPPNTFPPGPSADLSLVSGDSPIRTQCMHKGPLL